MEAKNCAKIPPILALNQPLDESLRPKSGKSRLNRNMAPFWKGKSINLDTAKVELKGRERAHDLKNQDASQGLNLGFNSKDSICFKWVQIGA
jgi:hypothetical protein